MIKIKKLMGDRVLVALDNATEVTGGGIYIPEQAKDKDVQFGTVRLLGPGAPESLTVGSRVFVSKWGGAAIESGSEIVKVFDGDEVFAVVDGTEPCAGCRRDLPVTLLKTARNGKRICADCEI